MLALCVCMHSLKQLTVQHQQPLANKATWTGRFTGAAAPLWGWRSRNKDDYCDSGSEWASLTHATPGLGLQTAHSGQQRLPLQADLEQLAKRSNILLLPAEGLRTSVASELRLSNAAALPFVRLRADFRTARVDGESLEAIFLRPG